VLVALVSEAAMAVAKDDMGMMRTAQPEATSSAQAVESGGLLGAISTV